MRCSACRAIIVDKRGATGHDYLVKTRLPQQHYVGQTLVRSSHMACTQCGTKWRYEDNENDKFSGWRAVG